MKIIFKGKDYEEKIKIKVLTELINDIEEELKHSTQTRYVCKDGYEINTDVGYVEEWFDKYVEHNKLKEQNARYCDVIGNGEQKND